MRPQATVRKVAPTQAAKAVKVVQVVKVVKVVRVSAAKIVGTLCLCGLLTSDCHDVD